MPVSLEKNNFISISNLYSFYINIIIDYYWKNERYDWKIKSFIDYNMSSSPLIIVIYNNYNNNMKKKNRLASRTNSKNFRPSNHALGHCHVGGLIRYTQINIPSNTIITINTTTRPDWWNLPKYLGNSPHTLWSIVPYPLSLLQLFPAY